MCLPISCWEGRGDTKKVQGHHQEGIDNFIALKNGLIRRGSKGGGHNDGEDIVEDN